MSTNDPGDDNRRLWRSGWRQNVVSVYEAIHRNNHQEDSWHAFSTKQISNFLHEVLPDGEHPACILDAGCGGVEYIEDHHYVVGIDLIYEALSSRTNTAIVGDIHELPFAQGSFDIVVCVGSVANYVDLSVMANEFFRVLRPGGFLILEYERSRSWLTLGSSEFGLDRVLWPVEYQNVPHTLHLYSDKFVKRTLALSGLSLCKKKYFHHLPPVAHRGVSKKIPPFSKLLVTKRTTFLQCMSANAICLYARGGTG